MLQHAAMQETSSAGNSTVGQKVFRKCGACHSLEPGRNMIGPSLGGIIGRKAGTEAGFTYSSAMKQANITWTPETLAPYLADPRRLSRETACRSRDSNRRMTATI
jgi:cytochrome c2